LIEKDGKYVGVEIKEHQTLMHQTLEKAGLKVIVVSPDTDIKDAFEEE